MLVYTQNMYRVKTSYSPNHFIQRLSFLSFLLENRLSTLIIYIFPCGLKSTVNFARTFVITLNILIYLIILLTTHCGWFITYENKGPLTINNKWTSYFHSLILDQDVEGRSNSRKSHMLITKPTDLSYKFIKISHIYFYNRLILLTLATTVHSFMRLTQCHFIVLHVLRNT